MVMLLAAYACYVDVSYQCWKVHTIMVSDMEIARQVEGLLDLPAAEVPYTTTNYEQTLGTTGGIDPLYMSASPGITSTRGLNAPDGLWYQLKKILSCMSVSGAKAKKNQQRHVF